MQWHAWHAVDDAYLKDKRIFKAAWSGGCSVVLPRSDCRPEILQRIFGMSRYLNPKLLKKNVNEPDPGFGISRPLISAPPLTSNAP
jgi:hypothetical protein